VVKKELASDWLTVQLDYSVSFKELLKAKKNQ